MSYVRICACICIISSAVQAYGCMHTNTYVYGDAHIYIHTYMHTYVCAYVRKITGIYLLYIFSVHKNTGMCACTYIHTYVCMANVIYMLGLATHIHMYAGVIT